MRLIVPGSLPVGGSAVKGWTNQLMFATYDSECGRNFRRIVHGARDFTDNLFRLLTVDSEILSNGPREIKIQRVAHLLGRTSVLARHRH